ncbi:efflux RND transporter periplasmic adaptor subunit [Lysobacter sp. Hz 25]|uniref:efflux RND transporter periplasmic adaptor subunit n=1 Tax=Lysobacter sp. Hz 25 TaxID=3383698 RepID=UPI0038D39EB4
MTHRPAPRAASRCAALAVALALLSGCASDTAPAIVETVAAAPLRLSVRGEGELKSAKATPLNVPGRNWASRQLEWMLPEGSAVRKGDLIARFSAAQGQQELSQTLIDLQRNLLARAAKQGELATAQSKVAVDLAQVAVELGIAERYASADLSTMARNEVLDAVQDASYLTAKRDTLEWQRGQAGVRGGAELAVLDAQRATFDLTAKARQSDLDALELRAPNDGVLMLSSNWSGDKPNVGATLRAGFDYGSLPDASAMELELSLPQIEAQGLQVGNAVEMFPVGRPEQRIVSRLSWVASAAKVRSQESPVKYLTMKAPIPAEAIARYRLVPGQRLEARVILFDSPKALSVANVAIDSDAGKDYVRVREGGDFLRRPIRLGVRGPARSQVLSGLRDGDEVLLAEAGAIGAAANTAEPPAETDDPGQAASADGGKTAAAPASTPQAVRP